MSSKLGAADACGPQIRSAMVCWYLGAPGEIRFCMSSMRRPNFEKRGEGKAKTKESSQVDFTVRNPSESIAALGY